MKRKVKIYDRRRKKREEKTQKKMDSTGREFERERIKRNRKREEICERGKKKTDNAGWRICLKKK